MGIFCPSYAWELKAFKPILYTFVEMTALPVTTAGLPLFGEIFEEAYSKFNLLSNHALGSFF